MKKCNCKKSKHQSESAAWIEANRLRKKGHFPRPYQCPAGIWHVGNTNGTKQMRLNYLFDVIASERKTDV